MIGKEIVGSNVKSKKGKVKAEKSFGKGKVVGLYFSAHWCGVCQAFTPKLREFYNAVKGGPNGEKFEIFFVSRDYDKKSCDEYYEKMPWLAVRYKSSKTKSLPIKYECAEYVPYLVFLDGKSGEVITTQGRQIVGEDPKGENFPWKDHNHDNA